MVHQRFGIAAIGFLTGLVFYSCTLFEGGDIKPDNDVAGTKWELESIETINPPSFEESRAFEDHEEGIWKVPEEEEYLLEFMEDGKFIKSLRCVDGPVEEPCNVDEIVCGGSYERFGTDSLLTVEDCVLTFRDDWGCPRISGVMGRVAILQVLPSDADPDHPNLHVKQGSHVLELTYDRPWGKGILHYRKK